MFLFLFLFSDATRKLIKTLDEYRGRSSQTWDFSFVIFGGWMILAMVAFLITTALFSASHGGGWIFLFLPLFYANIIFQFCLLFGKIKWKTPGEI